jgi:hypothetical protein
MKKIFLAAAIFVFMPCVALASAVLVGAKGDVKVALPGKAAVAAKVGTDIVDGAVITTGNGAMDEIASGQSYKVGEAKAAKRTDLGRGIALAMNELSSAGKGPTVQGMVREAKGPSSKVMRLAAAKGFGISAIYPRGTSVRLAGDVSFKWDAEPKVDWAKPCIVIEDANKARVAIVDIAAGSTEQKVASSTFKKGLKYSWYLAEKEPEVKGKTMRFEFATLSDAEASAVEADVAKIRGLGIGAEGTDIVLAQAYFKAGLVNEMVEVLLPAWQRTKAPYIKKLLWLGYSKMGQTEKAHEFSQ